MSHKIVTNIFHYLARSGANRLNVFVQPKLISLESRLNDETDWQLTLPTELRADFLSSLRHLSDLTPDELTEKKYAKVRRGNWCLNFHISVRPFKDGEMITIEFIDHPIKLWRLNQLGLSANQLKTVRTFLRRRQGLMVISSPPAGGRSSTLTALLLEVNNPQQNICWLCQPTELPAFSLPGVNYLNLGKTGWDRVLKHDADLILADDLLSPLDISRALEAANTGRLVIITLPAENKDQAQSLIKEAAAKTNQPLTALKAMIHQELAAWPRRSPRSPRQREHLGRFDVWSA